MESLEPHYPIYIISKGRPNSQLTHRELTKMGVNHKIVIEPVDFNSYIKTIPSEMIITLPFSDLGEGSTPVRNWVWDHAMSLGYDRHWVLDDNIEGFHRLNRNEKPKVKDGSIFRWAEIFTDRYMNIGLSGFNYHSFCKITDRIPAYYMNTRIYSCILVNNNIPFRWRGKYNEDTDLSLRVLKSGLCTVLFNAFLAGKVTTMRMKGGNTDNVYNDGTNRRKFAEHLVNLHPDCSKVVWRFNRWHHHVDYSRFKNNRLIRKELFNEF